MYEISEGHCFPDGKSASGKWVENHRNVLGRKSIALFPGQKEMLPLFIFPDPGPDEFESCKATTNKWAALWQNLQNDCASSEDSDQPGNSPSLIRVFAVRMKNGLILCYPLNAQRRLWSDWVDVQTDLSLRWAHSHFVGGCLNEFVI